MSQEPAYWHMWGIEIVPYDPSWGARFEAEAPHVFVRR